MAHGQSDTTKAVGGLRAAMLHTTGHLLVTLVYTCQSISRHCIQVPDIDLPALATYSVLPHTTAASAVVPEPAVPLSFRAAR